MELRPGEAEWVELLRRHPELMVRAVTLHLECQPDQEERAALCLLAGVIFAADMRGDEAAMALLTASAFRDGETRRAWRTRGHEIAESPELKVPYDPETYDPSAETVA